jgi:hypothetical protein
LTKWFDLTVAVDADGSPVTVSWSGDSRRNVIVWMDHRAVKQAEKINSSNSPVLQYCGGALSPEMEPPKVVGNALIPLLNPKICFLYINLFAQHIYSSIPSSNNCHLHYYVVLGLGSK